MKKLLSLGIVFLSMAMVNHTNIPFMKCPKCGAATYGTGLHNCPKR